MDNKLIAAIFKDGASFHKLKQYMRESPESVFTDLNAVLYGVAEEYYSTDGEAMSVDMDVARSIVERVYPRQVDTLGMALERIEKTDVPSSTNVLKEFVEAKKHAVGQKLASALISNGPVEQLLDEYESLNGEEALDVAADIKVFESPLRSHISSVTSRENLIQLYPEELNERVGGGLMRGHHVLVFARPEVGKSLVAMNMARGFVEQGFKVLYIGNEDPAESMVGRFHSSLLGKTKAEIEELTDEAVDEELLEAGIENFVFIMLEPGTPYEIRGLTEKYKPDVVIIDQLRNLNCKSEGLVQKLETAAKEVRNIAQRCNVLMVSVTQAGDSASDKLVLSMSDVDSSKTGIPAQVDVMVGVGMDPEYQSRSKRMFSLSKNKPGNDHSFFSVTVDEATSRIV